MEEDRDHEIVVHLLNEILDSDSSDSPELMSTPDSSSDDEAERRNAMDVQYDTALPMQHVYMGNDLQELTGRTHFEDNSVQTVLVLICHNMLICPGQVLPLLLFRPVEVMTARRIVEDNHVFGIVSERIDYGREARPIPGRVLGTTCEIRSFKEDADEMSGVSTMNIKAEGRQRFELLDFLGLRDGFAEVRVRILSETYLGNPTVAIRSKALGALVSSNRRRAQGDSYSQHRRKLRHNYEGGAALTIIPLFAYEAADAGLLMRNIRKEWSEWTNVVMLRDNMDEDKLLDCDPVRFSFWAIASLPIGDRMRRKLFACSGVIERLIYIAALLKKGTLVSCKQCNTMLAGKKHIFSMSREGPQGAYVNPQGYVHELLTVYKAQYIYARGASSAEYSWFPGYEWTCVYCSQCHVHLGWKFTATRSGLVPRNFYGLTRMALKFGISSRSYEDVESVEAGSDQDRQSSDDDDVLSVNAGVIIDILSRGFVPESD